MAIPAEVLALLQRETTSNGVGASHRRWEKASPTEHIPTLLHVYALTT